MKCSERGGEVDDACYAEVICSQVMSVLKLNNWRKITDHRAIKGILSLSSTLFARGEHCRLARC